MCFEQCTKCTGAHLFPLAVLSMVANLLLYFPNGETKYAAEGQLTGYVWFSGGTVGTGLLVAVPAVVLSGMKGRCCKVCCGHLDCAKGCPMMRSVLLPLFGMTGSLYCFIVSALALTKGPYCRTASGWGYPFTNSSGSYLFNRTVWSRCDEPAHVVLWNTALFSLLLGLAGMEFILCFFQLLNTLLVRLCEDCNYCAQSVSPA